MNDKLNTGRKGSNDRLAWLSMLRGFAAFLVFFSHLNTIPAPTDSLFILGRVGVVCFFLMTGYLTVASRERRNWKQYAWNRFLRVYPVYWLLLIIMFIVSYPAHSLKSMVLNLTLFEEFLGGERMLGASWMLPIQVVFFGGVAIVGAGFFVNPEKGERENLKRGVLVTALCMACAIATGAVRHWTGKPFPTAFFLLIGISILGIYYRYAEGNPGKLAGIGLVFEIGFVVAVVLSYPEQVFRYIVSYNIGIVLFIVFEKCIKGEGRIGRAFSELGKIGFTFFLGAGIPWILMLKINAFDSSWWMIALGCLLKFVLALALGAIVTKYIETPLLKWGKTIEGKLR